MPFAHALVADRSPAQDDASALVVVLVTVTLALTLAGALVLFASARLALVRRDVHRVETDYAAEAAAYAVLARLAAQPNDRPEDEQATGTPAGTPATLSLTSVRARGLDLEVAAQATWGTDRPLTARVSFLVARRPAAPMPAIAFGDTLAPLTLAAGTSVRGTIRTGPRGVVTGTLGGRPFSGVLDGPREAVAGLPLPAYDDAPAAETLTRQVRDLSALPDSLPTQLGTVAAAHPAWVEERRYDPDAALVQVGPGTRLGPADSLALRAASHVLAAGDLRLDGPLRLRPWTTLFVRGRLTVSGSVSAEHVLIVADRIEIDGPARLQGQLLARRTLRIDGGARLLYPSALYGPSAPLSEGDALTLSRVLIDGVVVVPPGADDPSKVRLVLAPATVVRGLVYSARTADVQGRIEGTLAVQRTQFEASPAVYVNWLRGLVVDRQARSEPFTLPFGLASGPLAPAVVAQRRWSWVGARLSPAP